MVPIVLYSINILATLLKTKLNKNTAVHIYVQIVHHVCIWITCVSHGHHKSSTMISDELVLPL